jgi:hypothetical protein
LLPALCEQHDEQAERQDMFSGKVAVSFFQRRGDLVMLLLEAHERKRRQPVPPPPEQVISNLKRISGIL